MAPPEPMIRVRDMSVGYGDHVLLEGISFEVERGEIFGILGESGSGKSTILRCLIGLMEPLSGTVELGGGARRLPADRAARTRPTLGVVFQSAALLGSLTLDENIALPIREWTRLPEAAVDAIVRARLAMVGLAGWGGHPPAELSGGMRKRAGIARALALDPPLLLLDEPSGGLDPMTAASVDELILTLNEHLGVTVVVVTHDLPSVLELSPRCILLDKRTRGIAAAGEVSELRGASDERARAFFARIERSC